jgi:hypothetical protein
MTTEIDRMPFGTHIGKLIVDIPSDYLLWVAEYVEQEDICKACDTEWNFREKFNSHFE